MFINKIKDFLGLDIKEEQNKLVDDKLFGKISKEKAPNKWVKSTCGYCGVGCGLYIGVNENGATYTKGDPTHKVNYGTLCPKGLSEHNIIKAKNRITTPLIRDKKYANLREASWDEVFSKASSKIKEIQSKYGKKSVGVISTGQLLTEEFYTLGKFVQLGLQTNNYDGNTTLCMASAVMGYKQSFGSDGPTGCYEDFEKADFIMLIGANIADNHPILKLHINKNKNNPKIVVVDPRKSKTAQMADIYVPIKPRTDLAFLNGLAHIIINSGWEDYEYIKKNASGFKEYKKFLDDYPPQEVANITGIDVKTLYEIARLYAGASAGLIAWTMGVNQSALGTDTVSAINNLAIITGNIGKEGAAPFSLTGQCNAMGTRESGFTSSIPGYRNFASKKDREEYANIVGVDVNLVPQERGYKYAEIIDAIDKGEIKALWIVATNPLVSFPNRDRLLKVFNKLELLIVQDAFMSDTAKLADIVFSAATWGEKEGTYTNSERRCNKANKAVEPIGKTKSDFDIVLEFSKYFDGVNEMLFNGWNKVEDAFNEWKKVSKGRLCDYSGMTYEKIEALGGIQWPCNEEAPNGTKRLYTKEASFQTKDKKAKLICANWIPMQENVCESFPLILNTGRTVEQWHTRTKTKNIDMLNDLAPEAWVDINSIDAKALGVKSGDRIDLSSPRGVVKDVIVRVTNLVAPGSVFVPFHFNTQLVNKLTQELFDPISGEPNFKQTAIQLHSKKVPQGIKMEKKQVQGNISYINVEDNITINNRLIKHKNK